MDRRQFITSSGAAATSLAALEYASEMAAEETRVNLFIIDCQSHLFVPEVVKLMERRQVDPSAYRQEGAVWIKMGDWHRKLRPEHMDVPAKLAAMDANGIAMTAISINDPGPEWFGQEGPLVARLMNDFISGLAKAHPTRFLALSVLPYQDRVAAEKEFERCFGELGMKGILLYSNLAGRWPDEADFRWVFAAAEERGIPILLHPAKPTTTEQVKGYNLTSTLGNMFENTIVLARMIASGLLDEHPNLKLVSPHLGGTLPYIAGRMDHQISVLKRSNQDLKKLPSDYMRQIYMDIVSPLPEAMRFAIDFSAPQNLLFSSDHPWVDPALILQSLRSLNLPVEDEADILSGNARRLFGV